MGKWQRGLSWGLLLGAGGTWGLGAARTAAHEFLCAPCFGVSGAIGGFLLGALAAALIGRALERGGHDCGPHLLRFTPLFLPLVDILGSEYLAWRGPVLLVGALLITVLGFVRLPHWGWFALSILLPLVIYLPDVSSYVGRADTFEFQVIGPQLGIAHPSGYPLYTLICKLFSLIPAGSVAWRINLTSVVFASLAAGLLYLTLARESRLLALLTALMLAFSPTLWSRAIEAEVYALNAFLTAAVLRVVVAWTDGKLKPRWAWPTLGLLMGLALASHITLGALGVITLGGLWGARQKPQRQGWFIAAALGCLGLLLYAYIPLRWPAVTGGERLSIVAFARYVTNAGSGGALLPLAFLHDPGRWLVVWRLLLGQVGWAGLALAGVGVVALGRKHLPFALGTLAAFGAWVWFNLSFYVAEPDYSAFLIPAVVVLVFWLGCGVQWVGQRIADYAERNTDAAERRGDDASQSRRSGRLGGVWVALLGGLVLGQVWRTGPGLDTISVGRADELWGRYVLTLPLEDGAAILADSEKFPPLYYLQQTTGIRSDLELVTLFSEGQYRDALGQRLATGQPVYLARYLPGVDGLGVSSVGPLVAVAPETLSRAPAGAGVRFGKDLRLVAHRLDADPVGRAMHHLMLTWRIDGAISDDLDVRLRLVDPDSGVIVWEVNEGRPVGGYTTTRAWQVGWAVDDYHALQWPEWVPGGTYGLELGLLPHFGREGLPVADDSGMWYALGDVTLPRDSAGSVSQALTGNGGDSRTSIVFDSRLWLLAAEFPGEASGDAPVALDLTWVCRDGDPEWCDGGIRLELSWVPEDGSGVGASSRLVARGEDGITVACESGDGVVVRRYSLKAPAAPGSYRLVLGWPGTTNARCRWLGPSRQSCEIGKVTVMPAMSGNATFDGRILLVSSSFDAGAVAAGAPLRVALTWRSVQALYNDYTVFVQVLGPDGKLYGQVDSWPGMGVRPTSGWAIGEEIADAYAFYVDSDAPSGEYRVIVGWYLLADMSRLPVLDGAGGAIGDYLEIGTFALP